jgi:hypothetical protein
MKVRYSLSSVLALTLGLLGLVQAFYPTFFSFFKHVQSDLGDTRFNHYILEHTYRWLLREPLHHSLWDPPFFYPAQNTLAYSDMLLGVAPFYWIFRLFLGDPVLSFQLWMISQFVITYILAAFLFRRLLFCSWSSAWIGGYLFAFANPRLAHIGHQQLIGQFLFLIIGISLIEICRARKPFSLWMWMLISAAAFVLQFVSSFYFSWFSILTLGTIGILIFFRKDTRGVLRELLSVGFIPFLVTSSIAAVMLVPVVGHYLQAASEVGLRDFNEVAAGIPHISHLLRSGPENLLWGWLEPLWSTSVLSFAQEKQLGVGLVTFFISICGLWLIPSPKLRQIVCLLFILLVVYVFVFPGNVFVWKYFYLYVPGAAAIRAPGRIVFFLLVLQGVGLTLVCESLFSSQKTRLWGLVLLAVVVAEQTRSQISFRRQSAEKTVETLTKPLIRRSNCKAFMLIHEGGKYPAYKYQLDAMWAALSSRIPTLNGYSGNEPPGWGLALNIFGSQSELRNLMALIRRWAEQPPLIGQNLCILRRNRFGIVKIFTLKRYKFQGTTGMQLSRDH